MKKLIPLQILVTATILVIVSCGEKTPPLRAEDDIEKNFYLGVEESLDHRTLENEMDQGETDYLRSFAGDTVPWQLWNKEILAKANRAQVPIFAFIGNALGGTSRKVAREIENNEKIRKLVSENVICTVIDTRVHPEVGQLCSHLANEIDRSVAWPMALWLSPEGAPIGWFPVGPATGNRLEGIFNGSLTMIEDIWLNSSRYSIENSRRDNARRQERFDFDNEPEAAATRNEIFRALTRKLCSFYDPITKDIDYLGGLLPSSSLELLAIGARSGVLTDQTRDQCRLAVRDVTFNIMKGAMRDPLDGGYFYARRSNDWVFPSFSKNLESQARLAAVFLKVGTTLQNEEIVKEGLSLLQAVETEWVAKDLASVSPADEETTKTAFFWSFDTLGEALSEDELTLAKEAFSLEEEGNIPLSLNTNGQYFELNTLRNETSLTTLAETRQTNETEIGRQLERIKAKLLEYRIENGTLKTEKSITVADLAMTLKALVARSVITQKEADLGSAVNTANHIVKDYWDDEKGLSRLKINGTLIPARGRDYAAASFALMLLYQHTLDDQWLIIAKKIMDHALKTFAANTKILAETPPEERIIPLRLHNISMIFGESTLGFADQSAGRLWALTGDDAYQRVRQAYLNIIGTRSADAVVNHTDFIISCAQGDTPMIAVVQGDHSSPAGRELLAVLNSNLNLPFLTIRPQTSSVALAPIPPLPTATGESSVVLLRDGKIVGQAATAGNLATLLNSAILGQE